MKKLTRRDFLKGARDLGISVGLLPLAKKVLPPLEESPPEMSRRSIEEDNFTNRALENLLYCSSGSLTSSSLGFSAVGSLGAPPRRQEINYYECLHCASKYINKEDTMKCKNCGGAAMRVVYVS